MKRFISVFLVLLLVPVFSFAVTYDEDSFLGVWVQNNKSGMSSTRITTIVLLEDHRAFYSVDNFDNMSPGEIERKMCSWSVSGNTLTLSEHGQEFRTLYRINTYQLSVDPAGTYQLFFDRVPNSEKEYDASVIASEPEPEPELVNMDPVGMWSFFWDARELNERLGKKRMSFDIETYNLYLFDDGSAYLTNCDVLNGKKDFSYGALDGIWIGDASDMTIKVGDTTYKAWINENGYLFLKMTDDMAFIMRKIENYNYKDGMLK